MEFKAVGCVLQPIELVAGIHANGNGRQMVEGIALKTVLKEIMGPAFREIQVEL